jgi:hypothetical protein
MELAYDLYQWWPSVLAVLNILISATTVLATVLN